MNGDDMAVFAYSQVKFYETQPLLNGIMCAFKGIRVVEFANAAAVSNIGVIRIPSFFHGIEEEALHARVTRDQLVPDAV